MICEVESKHIIKTEKKWKVINYSMVDPRENEEPEKRKFPGENEDPQLGGNKHNA